MLPSNLAPLTAWRLVASSTAVRCLATSVGGLLGTIAGLVSGAHGTLEIGALAATFAVLALASAIDLEERRIPNRLTYPAIGAALLIAVLMGEGSASVSGLGASGGFMFLAAAFGGNQLGMGDVKLSAFAGAVLGVHGVPAFLLGGTISGAVLAIAMLVRYRDRRATLAYAPCLSVGAALAALAGGTIAS